jgi:hypothetical protein
LFTDGLRDVRVIFNPVEPNATASAIGPRSNKGIQKIKACRNII